MSFKIKLAIAITALFSYSSFSMHQEGKRTAFEIINAHLVKHAELYEFSEDDNKFWGDMGPEFRLNELARKKADIIQTEIINSIDKSLEEIKRKNRLSASDILSFLVTQSMYIVYSYLAADNFEKLKIELEASKKEILHAFEHDPYAKVEELILKNANITPLNCREKSKLLLALREETGK